MRWNRVTALLVVVVAWALAGVGEARAQSVRYASPCASGACYATAQPARTVVWQVQPQGQVWQSQPVYYATQPAPAVQAGAATGDAYGFTSWLNGVRARHGLPAVGYDANLEAWAQQNNAQQNVRGLGHFVMGPARRQNSAMGHYASIGAMWMASPAHRSALLDPTIRFIGLAGAGAYWTFNAY